MANSSDLGESHRCCDHAAEIVGLRRDLAVLRGVVADLRAEVRSGRIVAPPIEPPGPEPVLAEPTTVDRPGPLDPGRPSRVDRDSAVSAKVALFRSLFAGRDDVYARRWENTGQGKSGWSPVHRGNWRTPRERREYVPLTDDVVARHLQGRDTLGLYPMLSDDTCRLLVCDFDASDWQLDARAYVDAARNADVPVALEISRSGNGGHVWTFFTDPVSAADARAMGAGLLREAMALRGELDLDSYDRFFPSQDHLPERGFGNLIALPLQGRCASSWDTTAFVDPIRFVSFEDQFAYLSGVERMTPTRVLETVERLAPVTVGPETRLYRPSTRPDPPPPAVIHAWLGGMLAIRKAGLPPGLFMSLKHLAMLANPAFFKNENLRLSNFQTPRFIRCFVEDLELLHLPRGLVEQASRIVAEAGSRLEVDDVRPTPGRVDLTFQGELRDDQTRAVASMTRHELGVLEAPPGAGKTVMACAVIAEHATPTLVLVDRKPLLEQWHQRLRSHLDVEAGQFGAGKQQPGKVVDVAMLQTITRSDDPAGLLDGYGLVVIDECHHVPAPTVERAVRSLTARQWLGLTATPYRADGLKEIMIMQCGPVRHRVPETDTKISRNLIAHSTSVTVDTPTDGLTRGEVFGLACATIVEDDDRTRRICADIATAYRNGRSPLVLSGRTEHVDILTDALRADHGLEPLVLYGSLPAKTRRAAHEYLDQSDGQVLLVATDRYIGEGFDCPRLDTLFMTFPVAAKGRIVQYAGRILRPHPGKEVVEVHDYVDPDTPMLASMWRKRQAAYKHLGFATSTTSKPAQTSPRPADHRPRGGDHPAVTARPSDTKLTNVQGQVEASPARIRAWAKDAGLEVANQGRIRTDIREAYRLAHQ